MGIVAAATPTDPAPPAAIDAPEPDSTRIVVLSWAPSARDTGDDLLKRTLRAELDRPQARFYPGVDLVQAGRLEPEPPASLVELRARVPTDAVARVVEATRAAEAVPWNGLSEDEWSAQARGLLELERELWFLDREELREPLFRLYAQIGRAAESAKDTAPPFYQQLGGLTVNLYTTLAGGLAADEPELLKTITDAATSRSIAYSVELVTTGRLPPVVLSFADGTGAFDPVAFASEYRVSINGRERAITDPEGLLTVSAGRLDIELERPDGYGLAARLSPTEFLEEPWEVLQDARRRIDADLRDALAADIDASVPRIDEEVLAWLAIYADLHASSEIFVAVPEATASTRRVSIWRWNREHGLLARVRREPSAFAIRFAGVVTGGLVGGTVRFRPANDADVVESFTDPDGAVAPEQGFTVDGIPLTFELRGHYRHFFMGAGLSYTFGWTGDDPWADRYPTEGNVVVTAPEADTFALRERSVRRLIYGLSGVAFGPGAAEGFGPRAAVRVGWTNVPHAVEMTAHAGAAHSLGALARSPENGGKRVQIAIDGGLYGGVILPVHDSLYVNPASRGDPLAVGGPYPTFGFSAGAGLTF